ncbi:hypothetical protein [Streptomyces cacaoi]|uniref:hypothetical protein n=1 Tax=Streptomyces cacaoi TaxID=1898 RepID=UPI0011F2F94D|nr:hypothetical protein [Streptomyces cacaoi]
MTSRREHPTNSTGAPPAHPEDEPTHREGDEPYLDGLFTYCLSVLCEHEAAIAAVGEALALAGRQRERGRVPADPQSLRPWLYALARWTCTRRLADRRAKARELVSAPAGPEEAAPPAVLGRPAERGARERTAGPGPVLKRQRGGAPGATADAPAAPHAPWNSSAAPVSPAARHAPGTAATTAAAPASPAAAPRSSSSAPVPPRPSSGAAAVSVSGPAASETEAVRARRRRELAALAWPEAAGTSPEQREALELSVRHRLPVAEIGTVLGLPEDAAEELLAHAACEVERTRAALSVVESGGCPAVSRLAGDDRLLLGTALRGELVRHVDECPRCRRAAERAMAGVSWPGTAPVAAALPLLRAPRPDVRAAAALVRRARAQRAPRFDRAGFPVPDKDRAVRRELLRSRAVTTTLVASVLAAPVLALWAAYRGGPVVGEPQADRSVAAEEDGGRPAAGEPDGKPSDEYEKAGRVDRSRTHPYGAGGRALRGGIGVSVEHPRTARAGEGRLSVAAEPLAGGALLTLTATADGPVRWTVAADEPWLALSRSAGQLRPGERAAVRVAVDRKRAPESAWRSRVRVEPAGSVVTLSGDADRTAPAGPARPPGAGAPESAGPSPSASPSGPAPGTPASSLPEGTGDAQARTVASGPAR